MLEVKNLSFSYNKKPIIENLSFSVKKGEFVGIIGPNGGGKSTILKNIYRGLVPTSGNIYIDDKDIHKMKHKDSAKKIGVVSQESDLHFDFLVEEIVAMGRSPHKGFFESDSEKDKELVNSALELLGMEKLSKRNFLSLSGGEHQRVMIARAIAQNPSLFILDEATSHLDISYQLQTFEIIKDLKQTVIAAIHDLNLASMYCDKLIAVKDGKILLEGSPEEVLTADNIFNIFNVNTYIEKSKITNKVAVTYLAKDRI